MKWQLPFYIGIAFFLLLSGCTKKEGQTYYLSDYIKQFSVFQVGSYWVYKNENTGEIDSSFIKSSPSFSIYQSGYSDPKIQECFIDYGGPFISSGHLGNLGYQIGFMNIGINGACLKSKPFQPGSSIYDGSEGTYKELSIYDSLIVNDVVYHQVLNTQDQYPKNNGDTDYMNYYLVKSIGLIKFKYHYHNQDTYWSLLRYHVVQ
jgi:hypothetical protein